jgi:spermidine synthase
MLVVGATGIIGQVVLMRELLVCFFGNELSIGIVLANWLLLEAIGSWLGGRRFSPPRQGRCGKPQHSKFAGLVVMSALLFPAMIYFTRIARPLLGMTSGEVVGPPAMFALSFVALLPVSLLHGALFTSGVGLTGKTGRIYVVETIGSILGGLMLGLLLIGWLGPFQIALIVALANFIALVGAGFANRQTGIAVSALVLGVGAVLGFAGKLPNQLERSTLSRQYPGQSVIYSRDSHYGRITMLEREEQYTILEDGAPTITLPVPDVAHIEEFIHLPMLSHPDPQRVLLIGGGIGGALAELLKYPQARIDYCELDPTLIAAVKQLPGAGQALPADPRISVKAVDGRRFLTEIGKGSLPRNEVRGQITDRRSRNYPGRSDFSDLPSDFSSVSRYDVILVSYLSPTTLQLNRYFTREFLALARARLTDKGILALIAPGSTAYLSVELARLNQLQLSTLQAVFPTVRVLPGDFNIFLAFNAGQSHENHEEHESGWLNRETLLAVRLTSYGFSTRFLTLEQLALRFSPKAQEQFMSRVTSGGFPTLVNSDLQPTGLYAAMAYWTSRTSRVMASWFNGLLRSPGSLWLALLGLLIIAFWGTLLRVVFPLGRERLALGFAVFSTGLAGATTSLLVLLLFQVAQGAVYYHLILLTTCFMAGTALGGFGTTARAGSRRDLYLLEIGNGLVGIVLVGAYRITGTLPPACFYLAATIAGFLLGAEFPLVNRLYGVVRGAEKTDTGAAASTAGMLYAVDLIGGFMGSLYVPLVVVPVAGMLPTVLAIAGTKVLSLVLLRRTASA